MQAQPTAIRSYDLDAEIKTYGSIDAAIHAADNDECYDLVGQLLARKQEEAERADPALKVKRLQREADAHDTHAEASYREAADWHGRAAFKASIGDEFNAALFTRKAEARERSAADHERQAFALRLAAAEIDVKLIAAGALIGVVA